MLAATRHRCIHDMVLSHGPTIFGYGLTPHNVHWTDQEKKTIVALDAAGVDSVEMMKSLPGRSHYAILTYLRKVRPRPSREDILAIVTGANEQERQRAWSHQQRSSSQEQEQHQQLQFKEKPTVEKNSRKAWTKEEDAIVERLVKRAEDTIQSLRISRGVLNRLMNDTHMRQGLAPHRSSVSVRSRWKILQSGRGTLWKKPWTTKEDDLLTAAVASVLGPDFYLEVDLRPPEPTVDKQNRESDNKHDKQRRRLRLDSPHLTKLDWSAVAIKFGTTRSAEACRRRFLAQHNNKSRGD
ncbi:hypothetical protein BGZ83_000914 [Gryganskiella cystojenkinii]|nr:hypothetical protein BGZ83_000914 [Gryganskiella cystojenkinii]